MPMRFAPRSGGALPVELNPLTPHAEISPEIWQRARLIAQRYLSRLRDDPGFSTTFQPCLHALAEHIETANKKIARLG